MVAERCLLLENAGHVVPAILHLPESAPRRGVVIVVGGPQYRVGSHRQFVLLARHLAASGIAVLRFDYRGMGDADGPAMDFRGAGPDIDAAVQGLRAAVPGLQEIALWGLCDAASAILGYVRTNDGIAGLAIANPWVHSETGGARTQLRHYYLRRLFSAEWWKKLLSGGVNLRAAATEVADKVALAARSSPARERGAQASRPFQADMLEGLEKFQGPVLLVISGNDLTAAEFLDLVASSPRWRRALSRPRVRRFDLAPSDHTFSRAEWRDAVARATEEWLKSW